MAYTELDLAQVEMRVQAGERCISRQKQVLKGHIDSGRSVEAVLQSLAEFEARLLVLRNDRNRIRKEIAAANTKQLLDMLWLLPESQRSLGDAMTAPHQHR
jgi:hypothetical protein